MKATITKTAELKTGTYKTTPVDAAKDVADVRFIYAYDSGYDVWSNVPLSGNGIKQRNENIYSVTARAADDLRKKYTCATDF